MNKKICLEPMGVVIKGIPREKTNENLSKYQYESIIRIFDKYVGGLKGLEEYSHIIIIYYFHLAEVERLIGRPWGKADLPEVGVFATRSPSRPNRIGLTVCRLKAIRSPYIYVEGLDAWNDTPVLDIKPYDYYDIVKDPRVPRWFVEYWNEKYREKGYDRLVPWLGP